MAQLVDARSVVSPAVDPTQLMTQLDEDAVYLALSQCLTQSLAPCADEERHIGAAGRHPLDSPRSKPIGLQLNFDDRELD